MDERFHRAIARFDYENSQDPNLENADGRTFPRELLYAERLSQWVLKLNPDASEALLLAARSQHLCRWKIPRDSYPADRGGYHRWRNELKRFHAELTSTILQQEGYDESTIAQVRRLNLKESFPQDIESRTLEDALCLMFLQHQFAELAQKTERSKVINALRKSWSKMTAAGRAAALELSYTAEQRELLREALQESSPDE